MKLFALEQPVQGSKPQSFVYVSNILATKQCITTSGGYFYHWVNWSNVKWNVFLKNTMDHPVQELKLQSYNWESNSLTPKPHTSTSWLLQFYIPEIETCIKYVLFKVVPTFWLLLSLHSGSACSIPFQVSCKSQNPWRRLWYFTGIFKTMVCESSWEQSWHPTPRILSSFFPQLIQ